MGDAAFGQSADGRRSRSPGHGSSVLTPPGGLPTFPDLAGAAAERADIVRSCRSVPETVIDPCVCGHGKAAHEHYRPGWDCGICGAVDCTDYRSVSCGMVRRALRRLGLST
jgi:hypothetical protein